MLWNNHFPKSETKIKKSIFGEARALSESFGIFEIVRVVFSQSGRAEMKKSARSRLDRARFIGYRYNPFNLFFQFLTEKLCIRVWIRFSSNLPVNFFTKKNKIFRTCRVTSQVPDVAKVFQSKVTSIKTDCWSSRFIIVINHRDWWSIQFGLRITIASDLIRSSCPLNSCWVRVWSPCIHRSRSETKVWSVNSFWIRIQFVPNSNCIVRCILIGCQLDQP